MNFNLKAVRMGRTILVPALRLLFTSLPHRNRRTGNSRNPQGPLYGIQLLRTARARRNKNRNAHAMAFGMLEMHSCCNHIMGKEKDAEALRVEYGKLDEKETAFAIMALFPQYMVAFQLAGKFLTDSDLSEEEEQRVLQLKTELEDALDDFEFAASDGEPAGEPPAPDPLEETSLNLAKGNTVATEAKRSKGNLLDDWMADEA